jgi:DNA-binding transcriptional regulator PaaX
MKQANILHMAVDSNLPSASRIVAVRLATLANRHGVTPALTYIQLAELCGISEGTVCAAVHRLIDLGIIERVHGKPRTRYQFLAARSTSSPDAEDREERHHVAA